MHQERIAVVTGANRGIGFEICRQLARTKVKVILTARDEAKGRAACKELQAKGLDVAFRQFDVTDHRSITKLTEYIQNEFGGIDILVNNAGIFIDGEKLGINVDRETVRRTMETNAFGPLFLSQALIPSMKGRGYGRIVNVSSGLGQLADMGSGYPSYRMSKSCFSAVTRILADELRGTNILVNVVCPGWVRTDMGGKDAERSVEEGANTAVWLALLPDGGPSGRFFRDRKEIPW